MCECLTCGLRDDCGDGSCTNDICPECEETRDEARRDEYLEALADEYGPLCRTGVR